MGFRISITETDNKILNHVEEFGSITIEQARLMFFGIQKYGYDMARKRLGKLVQYEKLKVARDYYGNQNIYYMTKKLSYHDLLSMDYYAHLINAGANIIYFKLEQNWMDKKYFSDAYCCYALGEKIFWNIVEVVRTHGVEVKKYKDLYESGEPQKLNDHIYKQLGGEPQNKFPRMIVIDNVNHKKELYINDQITIKQLDFNLKGFSNIFV